MESSLCGSDKVSLLQVYMEHLCRTSGYTVQNLQLLEGCVKAAKSGEQTLPVSFLPTNFVQRFAELSLSLGW